MFNKFKEKIDMYDMIIANLIAGKSVIEPTCKLNGSQIHIGFNSIASEEYISKYFLILRYPDYTPDVLVSRVRDICMDGGIKVTFMYNAVPYRINWDSSEMTNKNRIWKEFSTETENRDVNVFNERSQKEVIKDRERIIHSIQYFNKAEEQNRELAKVFTVIKLTAHRDSDSIMNLSSSIKRLNTFFKKKGIKVRELNINMVDWMNCINPFSQRVPKEMQYKLSRKVMSDDMIAANIPLRQGKVGTHGIPVGADIKTNDTVYWEIKDDPESAENTIITAETGFGKSLVFKAMHVYFLAKGWSILVNDYEGDEYTNIANYYASINPKFARIISMGKGSTSYFEPCEIPELTGDLEVDRDLKSDSVSHIYAIYTTIARDESKADYVSDEQKKIITACINRMYESMLVTDDMRTWHKSKGARLHDVYEEMKVMYSKRELLREDDGEKKHRELSKLIESCSEFFEPGGINSSAFKDPISADELYPAKFIVFSYGMKGEDTDNVDPKLISLKRLSVSHVSIKISNHNKYVNNTFTVKVWEEFQRWIKDKGADKVILNHITGGRKRGDINFIMTNSLSQLLSAESTVLGTIIENTQNFIVGNLKDVNTIHTFCTKFQLENIEENLLTIAKGASSKGNNKYKHAFCVVFKNGDRAIMSARLPDKIMKSKLYKSAKIDKDNKHRKVV